MDIINSREKPTVPCRNCDKLIEFERVDEKEEEITCQAAPPKDGEIFTDFNIVPEPVAGVHTNDVLPDEDILHTENISIVEPVPNDIYYPKNESLDFDQNTGENVTYHVKCPKCGFENKFIYYSPNEIEKYWINLNKEIHSTSPERLDKLNQQMIQLNGLISTVYFGIISATEILKTGLTILDVFGKIIVVLPLVFWIMSIMVIVYAWSPKLYSIHLNDPGESKKYFEKNIINKARWLKVAYGLFALGIIFLMVSLWFILNR